MSWKDDKELGRIRQRSKEKMEILFNIEDRAVSIGYIFNKLKLDFDVIARMVNIMVKHGVLEKIETSGRPLYRKRKAVQA